MIIETLPVSVHVDRDSFSSRDEEVHPGSDRTSRSVAWNQVPRENRIVGLRRFDLLEAFPKTDLEPLNNNPQHQFCRAMTHKGS